MMPVPQKTARAFSLIELLVVIGIFSLISIVVLANHSRFNSSVLLGSLAYDIGLSIREAQVYGISVKQFSNQFQIGYGMDFSSANSYTLFADVNANKTYNADSDSVVQLYTLGQGNHISRFCGITSSGSEECSDSGTPITRLDIVFLRPNPDAYISSDLSPSYSSAKVTVASAGGETRTVTVQSTGQISVSQ